MILDLTQERDYLLSQQPKDGSRAPGRGGLEPGQGPEGVGGNDLTMSGLSKQEKQHLSVELADTRAKLRRNRQELYVVPPHFARLKPLDRQRVQSDPREEFAKLHSFLSRHFSLFVKSFLKV